MKNFTIPAAALLLIIAGGFQNRQQSQAEARNAEILNQAADRLEKRVPLRIGEWAGVDVPVEDSALRVGEIAGCVSRTYTHALTGESAKLLLMCGSPGPISAHTPDICFAGNGYEMISEPKRLTVKTPNGGEAEFWWADFQWSGVGQRSILRTYWCWKGNGAWKVSDHPRIEFAGLPVLYKLYVAAPVNQTDATPTDRPNTEFLKALLWDLHSAPPEFEMDVTES